MLTELSKVTQQVDIKGSLNPRLANCSTALLTTPSLSCSEVGIGRGSEKPTTVRTTLIVTVYQMCTTCQVLHVLIVLFHPRIQEETLVVPILQMQKLRLTGIKVLFTSPPTGNQRH